MYCLSRRISLRSNNRFCAASGGKGGEWTSPNSPRSLRCGESGGRDIPSEPPSEEEFLFIILAPQLIGGEESIRESFRYPREALEQGIKGEVVVSFVVNEEGGVEDVVVDQSIGGGCDEEAVRVVREARFTPGRELSPSLAGNIYGEAVKVPMSQSVTCRPSVFRRLFD